MYAITTLKLLNWNYSFIQAASGRNQNNQEAAGQYSTFSLFNKNYIKNNEIKQTNEMAINPRKYLIKDLHNKPTPIDVWLQGTIEQNVGNDILIIGDTSGRAKITKCENADGVIDKESLQKGNYCCILGIAVKTKGLPEVQASKFVDLTSQPHMKAVWEEEVREANLILEDKIKPSI